MSRRVRIADQPGVIGDACNLRPASHPAARVVVFFPDDRGSTGTIDDRCSNANFFETRETALAWSAQRKIQGEVIDLEEARRRGLAHWSRLPSANRGIESR